MIAGGNFREDLYHRLAVGVLTLPPLRQRPGDLALLIEFQMDQLKKRNTLGSGVVLPRISAGARSLLNQHPWRGNIRELFNVLTRAVIWTNGSTIEKSDLEGVMEDSFACATGRTSFDRDLEAGFSLPDYLKEIETHFIMKAIESTRNHAAAARLLGFKSGPALRYRLEALGIKTKK
jgi:DNA-binding NtrC family response regulator